MTGKKVTHSPAAVKKPKHFTSQEIAEIQQQCIPSHVAIIPDGNRRWAAQRGGDPTEGHREGSKAAVSVVEAAVELGIDTITLYTFSTENWSRTKDEIDFLMNLLESNIIDYSDQLIENGAKLETIGNLTALSPRLQSLIAEAKERTKDGTAINVILAINYGARDEICRAIRHIVDDCESGKLSKDAIDQATVSRYLDTASVRDPDLFIRTSGEMRVSNFLLWQLCYSEITMPTVLWPDFSPRHLLEAVYEFQNRKRRFGA